MKLWPFAWIGKPFQTIAEQRKAAFGGGPPRYRYTQLVARKQWKTIARFKRKAS